MDGETIRSAVCWQLTTETEITVKARMFVDCSGDGLLAATAGALYRTGREAASEFNEQYAPKKADGWQMGASILLHGKDMGRPIAYTPPSFATAYDPSQANDRKIGSFLDGYWWVELGSEYDIIADQEMNRKTWEHLDLYYRTVGLGANTIITCRRTHAAWFPTTSWPPPKCSATRSAIASQTPLRRLKVWRKGI